MDGVGIEAEKCCVSEDAGVLNGSFLSTPGGASKLVGEMLDRPK